GVRAMWRGILAAVAGLALAFGVIFVIQFVGQFVYPPPETIRAAAAKGDFAAVNQAIADWLPTAPLGALIIPPLSWVTGTFLGTLAAAAIAGRNRFLYAGIVGGLALAATIANLVQIRHPTWMAVAGLVGVPLAAVAGAMIAPRGQPAGPRPFDMREKNMACK
ncbi:MAG: hypothetical protein SFU86_00500, partial [Pirellulaceae bacterium]|nr:hypothetical protein [Pirellulaceae bacterium]